MFKITNKDQVLLLPTKDGFIPVQADNIKPLDLAKQKLALEFMAMNLLQEIREERIVAPVKPPKKGKWKPEVIEGGKRK